MTSITRTNGRPEGLATGVDPIRVEMLSTEMPVHQLSKKSEQEIRVIRRPPNGGQVSLYWKVEPNPVVGHPGQLAYRLDTWVIKRRLDQMPRPIPRLIRVGDLRQIARELDLGGDTNAVRRAFEQNASAFIRAKVAYRSRDGREETFEGYFNRYNVFFRGQSLPGGQRAETVYISLNDPYHALINGSTWRPLDYAYLRTLTPAAQRLYELLSPKIFAAIKNGHPSAWIRYSDFCLLAVAKRQQTKRRMQSQMAAVHQPHLASGYFDAISWRSERAVDGSPDWIVHYTPGPRARMEFEAFNGLRQRSRRSPSGRSIVDRSEAQRRVVLRPATPTQEDSPAIVLARRFAERRLGTSAASVTASQALKATAILAVLEGDLDAAFAAIDLAAEEGRRDRNGFPKHLGGVIEGGFVERVRALRAADRHRAESELQRRRDGAARERFEAWCHHRADARIAALDPGARQRLIDERLPRFVEENAFFVQQLAIRGESDRAWAEPRILKRYGHDGEPPFEEWRRLHDAQPTDTSGPSEALQ